jgi:hypothetical protein
MFIQNNYGEVVNLDHVIALKVFDEEQPYNLHIFTEKTETIFQFDSAEAIKAAVDKIEPKLMRNCLWWAQCQNWQFRSDKILSINDECCRNLIVSMTGRDFRVLTGAKTDEELWECKKQIADSLSTDPFNSGVVMFDALN